MVFHALDTLKLENGGFSPEVKLEGGEIKLIEIGGRMGGDCIGSTSCGFPPEWIWCAARYRSRWDRRRTLRKKTMGSSRGALYLRAARFGAAGAAEKAGAGACIFCSPLQPFDHEVTDSAARFGYYILKGGTAERLAAFWRNKIAAFICDPPAITARLPLPEVVSEIKATVERDGRYDYEIILVNDNPPDDTYEVIRRLVREDRNIKGICMSRNFGQHAALMAGYREVQGDIVISLDDDGQTPAGSVVPAGGGIERRRGRCICALPSKKHSPFRNFGTYMNEKMAVWLLGKPKTCTLPAIFAMRPLVVRQIVQYHNPYSYVEGLVLRATSRVINVPVEHRARNAGERYTFSKLLSLAERLHSLFCEAAARKEPLQGPF